MSYDVELVEDGNLVYDCCITYNLRPMFVKALSHERGLRSLEGKCSDASSTILDGLRMIIDERERFTELNPPNGWGNVDFFEEFLEKLLVRCLLYPNAIIKEIS